VADGDTRAASGYWRLAWGRLRRDPLACPSAAASSGAPMKQAKKNDQQN
jgi:hypothetical protein